MASVRDLVEAGLDEGLVKQAVDAAGFERKRGRGGLNLDAKGVAKVLKVYNALLAKLTAKSGKVNVDKLPYDDGEEKPIKTKAPATNKASVKKTKSKEVVEDDEDEDEEMPDESDVNEDDEDEDEVEESDDEEDEDE